MTIRTLASAYMVILAIATGAWWLWLARSGAARDLFAGIDGWPALRSLAIADLAMICGLSLLAAAALTRRWRLAPLLVALQAGAILYATLVAIGMALTLDSGWMGVLLMVPCAVVSLAAASIPWLRGVSR